MYDSYRTERDRLRDSLDAASDPLAARPTYDTATGLRPELDYCYIAAYLPAHRDEKSRLVVLYPIYEPECKAKKDGTLDRDWLARRCQQALDEAHEFHSNLESTCHELLGRSVKLADAALEICRIHTITPTFAREMYAYFAADRARIEPNYDPHATEQFLMEQGVRSVLIARSVWGQHGERMRNHLPKEQL